MEVEEFFNIFLQELESRPSMHDYYKFLEDEKKFSFRKNYFLERLRYIKNHLGDSPKKIWDCGAGYGTTAIFLTLNGHEVFCNTVEYYYELIPERLRYWSEYGDLSSLEYTYQNHFDIDIKNNSYDIVLAQDTLHHLEPIEKALGICRKAMRNDGKFIVIEENGANIIQRFKLFLQRGNKRIIEIYDEKLDKKILLGNENIRSLEDWRILFQKVNMNIKSESINYIRFYLPFYYRFYDAQQLLKQERLLAERSRIRKNYLYFGLNFIASKNL